MAQSPAHKFGQIIGGVVEAAVEPLLQQFAGKHGLYLDKKGPRTARSGNKVTWTDLHANKHDLDFVLERGGTDQRIGTPVAFIESAWRRYTKHSRNKAQEIQGAVLPLAETHRNAGVLIGTILAGVFTDGALDQLRSLGFCVLYFPYDSVIKAFQRVRLDARFDEDTPDTEVARRVRAWQALPEKQHRSVSRALVEINRKEVSAFADALERVVSRRIESIRILPLHGSPVDLPSVTEAIAFIEHYDEKTGASPVAKYEAQIRYSNGDRIDAQFQDKAGAIAFLRTFQPVRA